MRIFNILLLAIKESAFEFLVQRHNTDVQLYQEFDKDWDIRHLKHYEAGYTPAPQTADQVFFKGNNSFLHIPLGMSRYIREQRPDVLILHSFKFAFQVFVLKLFLSKKTKMIVHHHGESPYKNPAKLWLQRQAFKDASAYFFSSRIMAGDFLMKDIIPHAALIHELPESSTVFGPGDKAQARKILGCGADRQLFLWVGRLNANKDPMTALAAFRRYAKDNPMAQLYMFYHEDELLKEVTGYIEQHQLGTNIHLKGRVPQADLETWYQACDYFVSASHYESTGYALCEALACGCVPVATDIPSFRNLTDNGRCAVLFQPGDADELYRKLSQLSRLDHAAMRRECIEHFCRELSFTALSKKFADVLRRVAWEGQ